MRKYGFSLEKENRRLPPVSKWLDPNYEGEISKFEIRKDINFPENWQTDFPTYDYKISEFEKIDYTSDSESFKEELLKRFNVEHISESWIDFYEIFTDVLNSILEKSAKRRNRTKAYRSFHVDAEAVYALNHLIKTKYPALFWEWVITEKRIMGITPYVVSTELYKRYPQCWNFGTECDGNIESADNIRSISNTVDNVQLFTAPLNLGTTLCMAQILSHEGVAVFSMDQIDTFKFCLIYILACGFETINIARPNSKSENIYFVCENFRGISKSHIDQMEQILRFTKDIEFRPAIFEKNKISPEFIIKFCEAFTKASIKREKKDLGWWVTTTNILPIRDHLKLIN